MHRIDGPGATVDNKFTDGDPVGGVQSTIVTDDWLNDMQEELMSLLAAAGITPVKGVQNQVLQAIRTVGSGIVGDARNSRMSVSTASASVTYTADEVVVKSLLGKAAYTLASVNKVINLATIGAGGMDVGVAPANGYVGIYVIYNPATGASALLAVNATSAAAPEIYGGANMPSGYTASALVSVWPTNASSLLVVGILIDRAVSFVGKNAVTTSTGPVTFTGLFINGIVPQNAKTIVGNLNGSSTSVGSVMQVFVGADVNGSGAVAAGFTVGVAGQGTSSFFEIDIGSIQQMFWKASSTLGTPTYNISISSYKF